MFKLLIVITVTAVVSLFVGFLVGVLVGRVFTEPQIQYYHRSGQIDGMMKSADIIRKEFGTIDSPTTYSSVFNAKYRSIVAIETSGVKTIREYE